MAGARVPASDHPSSRRRRLLLTAAAATAISDLLRQTSPAVAMPATCGSPPAEPAPFVPPDLGVRWTTDGETTSVQIVHRGDGFLYLVDGQPRPFVAWATTRRSTA